jgi:hypothetical protein
MNMKTIITAAAVLFFSSDKTCLGAKVGNLRGLEMGEGQDEASTALLPLVPTDPFFGSIKGDWHKNGEWRVHMSRSSKCSLTGESGPYPFGEYYCHRGTTPTTTTDCVSGPNDYCKCWIFPVCTKSNPNCSSGVSNGQHQECHVLIERPTGYNNVVLQEKLSATNWEVYDDYSPDLSF